MPSVPLTFFFIALVILLGFVTSRIFQIARFPDIPIILSVGLLIGPLNRYGLEHGFGNRFLAENIEINALKDVAPFVSSLALVVILFDSGLKLDFTQFRRSMGPAFAHTLPTFMLTVLLVSLACRYVMGMPPLLAVVLGVALSNVGQTVSAAIIREIELDHETRSIYFIEMAIYDLISIPILVSLLEFAHGGLGEDQFGLFAQNLARVISISLLLGVVGGLVWIYFIREMESFPYYYMVTLAGLLLVYSVNSFLGGSGPVSVLIFGLVIGNRAGILRLFKVHPAATGEGQKVHSFHDEITFFVRAFFFIFLGLTFATQAQGEWVVSSPVAWLHALNNTASLFLVGVVLVFLAILVARYVIVRFVSARGGVDRMSLFAVYGRGLGTAVLATFPFTLPDYQPVGPAQNAPNAYTELFQPWEGIFVNTALLIILLTVTGTSLTVWALERRKTREAQERTAQSDKRAAVKE